MEIATAAFVFCMVLTMLAGLLAARRGTKTSVDYLLAGRDHGAVVTSLSASATDVSGWVLMGLCGMAFSSGLAVIWVIPAGLLGYLLNWGFVARRLRAASAEQGSETFPEFLSAGFGAKAAMLVRLVASLIILVFLTYYLSGQFNACGKALRTFFGISYEWGVIAALGIILPYVIVAGMRGTSWSDVVQAILIAIAVIFVPVAALFDVGGISALYSKLQATDPALVSITGGKSSWEAVLYIMFWLSIGVVYPGQPQILTRFMAAKDDVSLTRGRWIAVCWFTLVASMAVLAGLAARAGFANVPAIAQDAEQIIPALANVFLPAVMVGIVLAAVTAAIITTADSMVLVIISTVMADASSLIRKKLTSFSLVLRVFVGLFVASIAALLAFLSDRSVFNVVLDAWAILGSAFTIVVFYRLWIKTSTASGCILGMICGMITAFLLNGDNYQIQIIVAVLVSAVAVGFGHMIQVGLYKAGSATKSDELSSSYAVEEN